MSRGVWLLVLLALVSIPERRLAEYSHWITVELSVRDGDVPGAERIIQALLVVDDAKSPHVSRDGYPESSYGHLAVDVAAGVVIDSRLSRSPPLPTGRQSIV